MISVAMAVLTKGPGDGIMDKENIASIKSIKYWPS